MNEAARVAVIIPCYRQAHYLAEAVASVVAQHESRWELVIVDDGSPDATAASAAALIAAHPGRSIRLLRQPNRGLAAARNAGIAATNAPYLLPLDADDRLGPDFLHATAAVLDTQPELGFVYTQVQRFGAETNLHSPEPYDLGRLRYHCTLKPASLFRRVAWAAVGGYHEALRGYEDWDFWLALGGAGWAGALLPRPLLFYRRAAGSMVSTAQQRDLELRASLILRHASLYPPDVYAWAVLVERATRATGGRLAWPVGWFGAFASFNRLMVRHAPDLLPKTLFRPIYWRLPLAWQARLRPWTHSTAKGHPKAVL